jgi:hypothetical protein
MQLPAIFQLYHGNQFSWWKKPEYEERTNDHGQATGKLFNMAQGTDLNTSEKNHLLAVWKNSVCVHQCGKPFFERVGERSFPTLVHTLKLLFLFQMGAYHH